MRYFWLLLVFVALAIIALLPIMLPSNAYTEAVKLMGLPL
jgi:hypothetical protein